MKGTSDDLIKYKFNTRNHTGVKQMFRGNIL